VTPPAGRPDDGSGYFLYHSIGMFPDKGRLIGAALAEFAAAWGRPDDKQWDAALAARARYIEAWRRLIGAPAGTLTATENVTASLHTVLGALPGAHLRGRRVLVAADCFPSLHFLLAGMAARHGFTLDTVPLRGGESWVREEDLVARWNDDVGVALLTTVTSTASYRCDLAALLAHGRRMGSLVGVDATQSVGLFPIDVAAGADGSRGGGADFLVATSLKWLGGTPGAGALYVREGLLQRCEPELRGWFSQPDPFAWALDGFRFAPDARRFDHGTPQILACVGSLPALAWHAGVDHEALLAHNRALCAEIEAGALARGFSIVSPRDAARRGGGVMIGVGRGSAAGIVAVLRGAGVHADARGATLRLSPGTLTSAAGVARLLDVLER
jgi:selenocysteine lyase/cysteine desulfurase